MPDLPDAFRGLLAPFRPISMRLLLITLLAVPAHVARAKDDSKTSSRSFDVSAGDASVTLRQFSAQAGVQLLVSSDDLRGVKTQPVRGTFTPLSALQQMLAKTRLTARQDRATGAIAVVPSPSGNNEPEQPDSSPNTKTTTSVKKKQPPLRAVLSSLFATAAFAQSQPAQEEPLELPQFTVSAQSADRYRAADSISAVRVRAPLLETPSSITVLTREFIDDVAPLRIYDATRFIAGVQEGRGITFGDRQIIRGFESEGRTVDNFTHSANANFEESLIDRLEVSKGPNAILSPGGVPGGSINVVTKSPRFTRQHNLTALVGLYDAQKVTLDMTDQLGSHENLAYRFIGAWQDSRRYWDSDARYERKVFAPQFTWRVFRNTELTVKYYFVDAFIFREPALILDPSVGPDDEPILGPGFKAKSRNGIDPWSGLSTDEHVAQFQLTTSFNEHVTTRLAGRYINYSEDSEQEFLSTPGFTNRYDPYTGELTQDYTWALNPATGQYVSTFSPYYNPTSIPVRGEKTDGQNSGVAVQNDWVFKFNTRWANLQTVAGWAASETEGEDRRWNGTLPALNLINPRPEAYPVWDTALFRHVENEGSNLQAYINQRVGLWGDRLILNGGYLYYDTDTKTTNRLSTAAPGRLDASRDMYLGSLLFKVLPNASVYYSYSTNATPTIVNNSPLWRDGKQHEVGGKLEVFDGRLSFNAAYFEIAQTNISVPNPERLVDPTAPQSLLADYENHGVEFEVSGAVTRNLSVFASYSNLKLRDALGRRVRSIADDLGSVMLNYRFTDGMLKGLSLNVGASYTGKRAGDATPVNFTPLNVPTKISFFVPSYTVYNAGASYAWDRYVFRLYVDNLTDDKDYVQLAGSRIATGTATGINVRFSATLKF